MKIKKYEQAIDDCNTSIELDDKNCKLYLRRAEFRNELGQFEAFIADYKKVKEIDPSQDVSGLIYEASSASTQAKKNNKSDISRDFKNGDISNNNSYSNESDISSDDKNDDVPIDPEGIQGHWVKR